MVDRMAPTEKLRSMRAVRAALVVLITTACGGDGPTKSDPASGVATVLVTGQPAGPILVGDQVQLVATPLNASGAVVSDRHVSWTSSDPTLATISAAGLVNALRAGAVSISATSGSVKGSVVLDQRDGGSLGSNGGTLSVLDNSVTLTIPSGALAQSTTILFRPIIGGVTDPRMVAGTAFEIGPAAFSLSRYATLRVLYDPAHLAPGTLERTVQLYVLLDGVWTPVAGSWANPETRTVLGNISGAGSYALVATPVSRISLGGPLEGGALYLGQSNSLTAVAYDAHGATMSRGSFHWTSSNQAIARVDSTGLLTGVGVGTATITAEADGQSASATVPVLPLPAVVWGQLAEWSTFQGNAKHTGEIVATVNPVVFREIWSAPAMRGPVTLGDGQVYGIRSSSLVALDAQTGAQKWTYNLGARDSYDPPAFGNGTVYLQTGGHENSFVWAVSAGDGSLRWRTAYGNQWYEWYAPVVVGQSVYVAAGGYGGMEAYDATQGTKRWSVDLNQYDRWTPAVANGRVYAYTGSYRPGLSVFDAATGALDFEIADPEFSWRGWSMKLAPVLGTQNDVIAQPDNRLVSFDLGSRRIRWQVRDWQSPWYGIWQATVANGAVYAFNGNRVEARSELNGSLYWAWPLPAGGTPIGTMIAVSNVLFVSATSEDSETGFTYAVDLTSQRSVWRYPLAGQLAMGANGVLYISGENELVAIAMR